MNQSYEEKKETKIKTAAPSSEPDQMMSVKEFAATSQVSRTLLAGFVSECKRTNAPTKRSRADWQSAVEAFGNKPAG